MTREEVIKELKEYEDKLDLEYATPFDKAILYAIKALSQEPTIQDKQAESEKYQKAFDDGYANGYAQARFDYEQEPCDKCVYSTKDGYCQYDDISETIPPLEPCDDTISRSDMLDTIGHGTTYTSEELQKIIQNLPSVNPKPCDDAISREWLMRKAIERFYTTNYFNHISAMIEEAPPVTHKSGKWIEEVNDFGEITKYHCSKCYEDTGFTTDCKWKFCPNCGAYMVEPQESEDKE